MYTPINIDMPHCSTVFVLLWKRLIHFVEKINRWRLETIILVALFAFVSVSVSVAGLQSVKKNAGCSYLAQVPGDCPNITVCTEVCTAYYRGVGRIIVECIAPSGPIYWWQCRCNFKDGAPCPPPGPPACPKPPDHMVHASSAHRLILNQTLAVLGPPNKRPF